MDFGKTPVVDKCICYRAFCIGGLVRIYFVMWQHLVFPVRVGLGAERGGEYQQSEKNYPDQMHSIEVYLSSGLQYGRADYNRFRVTGCVYKYNSGSPEGR